MSGIECDDGFEASVPPRGTVRALSAPWRSGALVFGLALLVRLIVVAETSDLAFVRHLQGDAAGYFAWGSEIAGGAWVGEESFYQAPLYPYSLGVLFSITGPSVVAILWMQCLMGACASLLLFDAARHLFGAAVGVIAGLMFAGFPPAILADDIVQKTSLGALLTCAILALLSRCLSDRAGQGNVRSRLIGLGVLGALLCLVRENALVWLGVLFVFSLMLGRSGGRVVARRHGGALLVGVALVLFPVAARNAYLGGGWSLATSQSGPNFYIGNSAEADGRYRPLVRGHETPEFERGDARRLAEEAIGRSLSAGAVSRYWFGRAMSDIRDAPGRWLALMGRKTLMVINRYEVSDVESLHVYAGHSRVLGAIAPLWHFGVLAPLAAVGIVATRSHWRSLWVCHAMALTMWAAVAAFFILARYRFPLVPVLTPFAAAGVVGLWRWRAGEAGGTGDGVASIDSSARGVRWALLAGVVAAVVCNWPIHDEGRLNALAQMNLGVAMAEDDLAGAMKCFERAVALHPGSLEARFNLGQALLLSGDAAAAADQFEAAIAIDPNVAMAHLLLGRTYEETGEAGRALKAYQWALGLDSSLVEARRAIDRLSGD